MALGKPAIVTPNGPPSDARTLRLWQQAVDNIRERFAAAEAAIVAVQNATTAAVLAASSSSATFRTELADLVRRLNALSSSGTFTAILTAAEDITAGAPVWSSADGSVSQLDPDSLAASAGYFAIAAQGASAGDDVEVRLPGGVVNLPGSTFTTGRPLYATLGGMTHTPTGNSFPVGLAIGAEDVAVGHGFNVLGDAAFDLAGQDYMAITRALAAATGGAGGVLPVVTGEVPPVLVYLDDGSLVYSGVA